MKTKRQIVTVRGATIFPIDMLRYDGAWPRNEVDSNMIALDFYRDEAHGTRDVHLLTDSPAAPNYDRWRSFGWTVVKVEKAPVT